jgi:hypothetical protein
MSSDPFTDPTCRFRRHHLIGLPTRSAPTGRRSVLGSPGEPTWAAETAQATTQAAAANASFRDAISKVSPLGGRLDWHTCYCEFSAGLRKSEAVPLGDPVVPVLDGFVG